MKIQDKAQTVAQRRLNTMQAINDNVRLLVEVFGLSVDQDAERLAQAAERSVEAVNSERRQLALFEADGL
jgi:hypothetical protein